MQTENPSLQQFYFFVGAWEMELTNADFLPNPKSAVKSQASFNWVENGAFLAMNIGTITQPPYAIWLINSDNTTGEYKVFYFDDRRVSRIYDMSFDKNIWKMWRSTKDFSQRFEGRVSQDKRTITAHWEKSTDGNTWEHDFDVTYKKL